MPALRPSKFTVPVIVLFIAGTISRLPPLVVVLPGRGGQKLCLVILMKMIPASCQARSTPLMVVPAAVPRSPVVL